MGAQMKRAIFFAVLPCLLAPQAFGALGIKGGSERFLPQGRLTTLSLTFFADPVVVAIRFPKIIDLSYAPGYGQSGNGEDNTTWEEVYKVKWAGGSEADVIIVKWGYSTVTRKVTFLDKQFDLPAGKIAVLSYDKNMKPVCELRDNSPAEVDKLRKELGEQKSATVSQPTTPAPE